MKRVFVGMSGGVDSSVSAKRLIELGYDVVGVFIKVWQPDFIRCDWEKERLDAMRVAAHLGIPFLTMNGEEAYKQKVVEYMVQNYKEGRTPNPDVMCNEHVKFGVFYTWARSQGADYIATGHYARVKTENGKASLHTGIDSEKDQSYFLSRIDTEVLPHVLFPIGYTVKGDVRKEAERAHIPTARKADSQGICFLGQIDMKEFLGHYLSLVPGPVLNTKGEHIGEHEGALLYTLGQRQGFTIHEKGMETRPHYVVDRDIEKNTLTVDDAPRPLPVKRQITLTDIREIGNGFRDTMEAVFRYRGPRIPVQVERVENGNVILLPENSIGGAPATGQICALYVGDECCGGGIIS
jgi:tRNA-uridine 2-sulfurtransferase